MSAISSNADIFPFSFKDGSLFCENVQIDKIFEQFTKVSLNACLAGTKFTYDVPSTPAYVYSTAALKRNVRNYLEALQVAELRGKLGYAIKANPNLKLVEKLKSYGVEMIIAVSGYEVLAGIRAGFSPENILLNGNGKQRWEVKLAIENGVMLNVDSVFDARQIAEVHENVRSEREAKVLLRIRPSKVESSDTQLNIHDYVNTAENSKFGFDISELDEVLEELASQEKIEVVGVHSHFGSGIDNPKCYEWLGATLCTVSGELKGRGIQVKIFNVGGGIGINYLGIPPGVIECFESEMDHSTGAGCGAMSQFQNGPDIPISEFISALSRTLPKGLEIIVEPGRTLVGNAAILLSKTLGTKLSNGRRLLVVDGSMNEVIRPCLYGSRHQILPTRIKHGEMWEPYDVVGPVCESADFLGRNVPMQAQPKYIAVMDCGAYCSSMASTYNLKPRAAEILVDGTTWRYIRQRDTFNEITDQFDQN